MIRVIAIFTVLLFSLLSNAQQGKMPYKSFEKGHQLEWVKPFVGEIGKTKVKLSLGFDGYLCKGDMTYLKSNTVVNLDGTIKGDSIKLLEYSKKGTIIGLLIGKISDDGIRANWLSEDGKKQIPFIATKQTDILNNGVADVWVKLFKSNKDKKTAYIILSKNNNQIHVKSWNNKSLNLLESDGKIRDEHSYELIDFQNQQKVIASQNKNSLQLSFQDKKGKLKYQNFELVESIPLKSKSFANQSTSYEFIFPISKDKKLNQLIQDKITPWLENCRNEVQKNIEKKLVSNHSSRGFSWFELTYADDDIFSGILYFRNTWTNEIQSKTINFSYIHDAEITHEKVFKKRAKYKHFVQEKLNQKLKQNKNEDKSFQQWMKHANFKYYTFSKNYLFASTEMSGLYGKETLIIPLDEMSHLLKRKNWVNPL